MKRRLFNLLAAASLVLCVATAVEWMRSYGGVDRVTFGDDTRTDWGFVAVTCSGDAGFGAFVTPGTKLKLAFSYHRWPGIADDLRREVDNTTPHHRLGGFGLARRTLPRSTVYILTLPLWSIALALAALPAVSLLRLAAARRKKLGGLCPTCGYDLRATPDRCPECGAVPAKMEAAT